MFNKIRNELMNDDGEPLAGDVEVDETGVHGRPRGPKMTKKEAAVWRERQVSVLGMVERGGRLKLRVIKSRRGEPLSDPIRAQRQPILDPDYGRLDGLQAVGKGVRRP
jgi:hypothetical protein